MKKPIADMSGEELEALVEERRERRLLTPRRAPRRRTVKSLSQAWGISENKIIDSILELYGDKN